MGCFRNRFWSVEGQICSSYIYQLVTGLNYTDIIFLRAMCFCTDFLIHKTFMMPSLQYIKSRQKRRLKNAFDFFCERCKLDSVINSSYTAVAMYNFA